MVKKLFFASIILLAVISICFADSVPNMKAGLWEITIKTEMPGMTMAPIKHTQCLTKKDFVPQGPQQPGQECEITDVKVDGDTVTWVLECESPGGKMKGMGTTTYSGDSFKGTMEMIMAQTNMKITTHMSGKRIGECK